jgi:putative membrane protein
MFFPDHHFLGGGYGMMFIWLIFIIFVIVLIIWLINNRKSSGDKNSSALDKLNKRYAAGEISEEEYQKIKKEITRKD